jgi:repressor LexA
VGKKPRSNRNGSKRALSDGDPFGYDAKGFKAEPGARPAPLSALTDPAPPLTPNEKSVLEFIESYLVSSSVAPTFKDIRDHFGFASFNSVQRYLHQLELKGYLRRPGGNQKRALVVLRSADAASDAVRLLRLGADASTVSPIGSESSESLTLPILGRVAAGRPVEAYEHDTVTTVPRALVRDPAGAFALRVQGDSMVDEGILDGDIIMVQKQVDAANGDLVVANVSNEATVKRYFLHSSQSFRSLPENVRSMDGPVVELRPSNATMTSLWYPARQVRIEGIVTGLVRKF